MKKYLSTTALVTALCESRRQCSLLRNRLCARVAFFRSHRSSQEQHAVAQDFSLLLAAWGIADDADIPGVISALRLRLPVFAVPMLACLITAAWSHSPLSFLSLACVAPPCLLGMVTTLWRISLLRNRRFLPFGRWLLQGVGVVSPRP